MSALEINKQKKPCKYSGKSDRGDICHSYQRQISPVKEALYRHGLKCSNTPL